MTLRLLTYNIWDGGVERVARIAVVIAAADPDVALLNEADDQRSAEQLARDLSYDCLWARGSGTKHIALLTRLPVTRWQIHNRRPITQAVLEAEIVLPPGAVAAMAPASAAPDSGDQRPSSVVIFGVHLLPYFMLLPFELARLRTVRALLRRIRQTCRAPHLILGDFNATMPGERASTHLFPPRIRRQLLLQANLQPHLALPQIACAGYTDCYRRLHPADPGLTWMPWDMSARLDYVFADPQMSARLRRCEVLSAPPAAEASDHFPLLAEFEI